MSGERVEVQVEDGVAVVALSRPEKHNALDIPMFEGIAATTERLAREPGLRAVVLHGNGPSFCSGPAGSKVSSSHCGAHPRTASSAPHMTGSTCRCR